jgi:hypothetical protein
MLGILLATAFGDRYGDEFSPNIILLVVSFLLTRSILYWVLFKSIIKRDISWLRNILQTVFIIISLSVASFILAALPSYFVSTDSDSANTILFFADIQGTTFYFVLIPSITLLLSAAIHKLYKLEPW